MKIKTQRIPLKGMSDRDKFIRARHNKTTLNGGIFSSIISNVLANARVNKAVSEVEEVAKDVASEASSLASLASSVDEVDRSLATFVRLYINRAQNGSSTGAIAGSPFLNSSITGSTPGYYLTGTLTYPILASSAPYARHLLSGGFLSGLKKVAKAVTSTVAKVADIPVLGTALKAIPGVGTVLNLASDANKIISAIPDASTSQSQADNTDGSPAATASELITPSVTQSDTDPIVPILDSTQQAAQALTKTSEIKDASNNDAVSVAEAVADSIPPTMESALELRKARLDGASLMKNAAILGYALKGTPSLVATDAADYIISISSIPGQSAATQGLTLDPAYGVWKVSSFAITLLPGIVATDMTAAMSILVSLSRMGSDGMTALTSPADPSIGSSIISQALGAMYFAAAVPYLASVGDFSTISSMASAVAKSIKPEVANVIAAHLADYSVPSPSVLANYALLAIALSISKSSGTADEKALSLLSQLKSLGSSVLTRASASDLDAINLLLPVPLAISHDALILGDIWLSDDQDEESLATAYLTSASGSAVLDKLMTASENERATIMESVPLKYRTLVREVISAYDSKGETGVSKVLSSIGSYISKTFKALF